MIWQISMINNLVFLAFLYKNNKRARNEKIVTVKECYCLSPPSASSEVSWFKGTEF